MVDVRLNSGVSTSFAPAWAVPRGLRVAECVVGSCTNEPINARDGHPA